MSDVIFVVIGFFAGAFSTAILDSIKKREQGLNHAYRGPYTFPIDPDITPDDIMSGFPSRRKNEREKENEKDGSD